MTRSGYVAVSVAIVVLVAALLWTNENNVSEKSQADFGRIEPMDLEKLKARILDKDWDALDIVDGAAQPEQALDLIAEMCRHDDPETREIALNCAALISDARIPMLLAAALSDEDEDVRLYALQALQEAYDESIVESLVANLENEDDTIRGGVALLLGQVGRLEAMEPLKSRLAVEPDEDTRRDIKLALARLGDVEMREEFVSRMDVNDSRVRLGAIEDLKYIAARELAVRVRPAMDDLGQGHMISDMNEPKPRFGRVCDAAVNLIAELCDNPFSFEPDRFRVYSDDEINEVKKFLESLKSEEAGN